MLITCILGCQATSKHSINVDMGIAMKKLIVVAASALTLAMAGSVFAQQQGMISNRCPGARCPRRP